MQWMQKLLAIRKYRITNPQSPIVGIAEDLSFHSKIRNSSKVLRRNFDRVCKIDLVYNARDVRHIARQDRSKRICIRYIVRCIAISWGGIWATREAEREEATEIPARLWASRVTCSQLLVATLRTLVSFRRVRDARLQRRSHVGVHVLTFRRRSLTVQTRLA